jgi:hypothetical protein
MKKLKESEPLGLLESWDIIPRTKSVDSLSDTC